MTLNRYSLATFKPCREESVNFDQTENLFIEGDNLEVLKLLQKAYYGKVKMIYIDPPYNTGKEFIYPDKYAESLDTYLAYTGQVDAEGRKFSTNTEAEGRFHSKWLNMMLPRLYLARNLLREDGVIFISIDDGEARNLRAICDEVFGEENFVAQMIWEGANKNDARQVGTAHEYVLVYARNRESLPREWGLRKEGVQPVLEEVDRLKRKHGTDYEAASKELAGWFRAMKATPSFAHRRFHKIDGRGAYKEDDPTAPGGRRFELRNTRTGQIIPLRSNRGWGFDQQEFDRLVDDGRISFVTETSVMVRRYLHETDTVTPPSVFYQPARSASERLGKLVGKNIFEFPKDETIVAKFVEMACGMDSTESLILDFFSGSCTTAHAVLDLNKKDGGSRKFIMVQLPEPCDEKSEAFKAGYKTIADIGKERIRRVIKKFEVGCLKDDVKTDPQASLFSETHQPSTIKNQTSPLGFKVFKLARSNFKVWDSEKIVNGGRLMVDGKSEEQINHQTSYIAHQLELHEQHIDPNAGQEDILYELLLKAGFPLATKVEKVQMAGKDVFSVADGALLICLEREITKELIKAMAEADPLQVICLDEGFKANDQLKANAVQTFKARSQGKDKEAGIVFRTV